MKRTFLKVLPFAAALLLATSCSKDDNNSTDEIVNGGEQIETVTKTVKTLTIKGKVKQSISKVTTNSDETALAFEANDVFTFGQEGDAVYGTITILDANGNYTATVNYTDETALFNTTFTAIHGENPSKISEGYSTLAAAVQHACYETAFTISYTNDKYSLASAESSDIVINLKSAFIKALSAETTTLGGENISVAADNYYVVPVGKTMGNSSSSTIAGQIYSLGTKVPENCIPGIFSVSADKKVYFSKGNLQATTSDNGSTWSWGFASTQYAYIGNAVANNRINGSGTVSANGTVDLFGWVGASSTFTGAVQYGISNSKTTNSNDTYGTGSSESLKSDWGKVFGDDNTWSTLSTAEWQYLFNRKDNEQKLLYGEGSVDSKNGLIILPDGWDYSKMPTVNGTTLPFTPGKSAWTNSYTIAEWTEMEKNGAVFLPAAGYRYGSDVDDVRIRGDYWSSSANGADRACNVEFGSGSLYPGYSSSRYRGFSVRLVRAL